MLSTMEVFYTVKDLKNDPKTHDNACFIEIAYQALKKNGDMTYRFGYIKQHSDFFKLKKKFVYEVIKADKPIKIFFDIEFEKEEPEFMVLTGMKFILEEIKNVYKNESGKTPRIIVLESHRLGKWSYHLILPDCAFDMEYVKNFFTAIQCRIPEIYRYGMDGSVYSSRRNFRLLGHAKINHPDCVLVRSKTFGIQEYNDIDTLVQNTTGLDRITYDIKKVVEKTGKKIKETSLTKSTKKYIGGDLSAIRRCPALKKILEKYPEFVIRSTGKMVILNRVAPSMCEFCERVHENDNTHFIIRGANTKDYLLMCRRYIEENDDKKYKNFTSNTMVALDSSDTASLDNMLKLVYS